MYCQDIKVAKTYALNKTISFKKCGTFVFSSGAWVKVISVNYGLVRIVCSGFTWAVEAEDLDEIKEDNNEIKEDLDEIVKEDNNVNKLLNLRSAQLRRKFTRWNYKIMKGIK